MSTFLEQIPFREMSIVLLALWLNAGMKYVEVKPEYVRFIGQSRFARFLLIFTISFLYFSFDFRGVFDISVKIFSALVIAVIYDFFLSSDAIFLSPKRV